MKNDKYAIITFDIFDTLVKRNVLRTTEIFNIVEERIYRNTGKKINGFAKKRVEVENELRKKAFREITIEDIYIELEKEYGSEVASALSDIECETEIDLCSPNMEIVKLYNEYVQQGKRIFLISDMYLNKKTVVSILA